MHLEGICIIPTIRAKRRMIRVYECVSYINLLNNDVILPAINMPTFTSVFYSTVKTQWFSLYVKHIRVIPA